MKDKRKAYEEKLNAELEEWNAQIALLKARADEARRIGDSLSIDWRHVDLEQFRVGLLVELEHGTKDPETNVTNDDMSLTGKIALAHLKSSLLLLSVLAGVVIGVSTASLFRMKLSKNKQTALDRENTRAL